MAFSFPASNTTSSSSSLFGTTTNTATSTSGGLFANKGPTSTSLFGSSTTTTPTAGTLFGVNPSLSASITTTTTSSSGLFGNLTTSKPTAAVAAVAATPSLFGNKTALPAAPVSSAPSLFGIGNTGTAGGTTSLFGNTTATTNQPATTSLFGATNTQQLAPTATTVTKEDAVTLGGIRSDHAKSTGPKAWRNEKVPEPVCKLVNDMKLFLKEQKDLKDEISGFSPASIDKVKEEVDFLIKNVRYLAQSVTTDSVAVANLKNSVINELKNCEIAQRTRDSTNLPLEISQPMEYFYKLVNQFEEAIQMYKVQIDEIESVMTCDSNVVTTANIGAMLNRMQQIFVALASKLHTLHEDIKLQKDFYLNYRKVIYKDDSNIFEIRKKGRLVSQVCPTPFSDTNNMFSNNSSTQMTSSTLFNQPSTQQSSGLSFSNPLNTTSTFPNTTQLGIKKKR